MNSKFSGDFVAGFIPRVKSDGLVEVLAIGVLPFSLQGKPEEKQPEKWQIKMPGGCAKNLEENEDLRLALLRELGEEIFAEGVPFDVEIGDKFFSSSKRNRDVSGLHRREFYYTELKSGVLRKENKTDTKNGEPDEILSPPDWLEVEALLRGIFHSHKEPLRAGLEILARRESQVFHRYHHLLRR